MNVQNDQSYVYFYSVINKASRKRVSYPGSDDFERFKPIFEKVTFLVENSHAY